MNPWGIYDNRSDSIGHINSNIISRRASSGQSRNAQVAIICRTSIDENVSELGVAISQDLLASGTVHYRDVVYLDGVGFRIVNDCLNKRIHNSVDVFVYTKAEEKKFGVRHLKVWVLTKTEIAKETR